MGSMTNLTQYKRPSTLDRLAPFISLLLVLIAFGIILFGYAELKSAVGAFAGQIGG